VNIHETAIIAAAAVIIGDVTIGPGCRVQSGAVLDGSLGPIALGATVIVLENAVLRGTRRSPLSVGNNCIIGPHAHVAGATIGNEVFVATGASVFNGAVLGNGCEIRINAVVHVRTVLEPGATVPIGWIAAGDPAQLFSPDQHEKLWAVQKELDFPGFVFGVGVGANAASESPAPMIEITERWARAIKSELP